MKIGKYWDRSQVACVNIKPDTTTVNDWNFSAPAFITEIIDQNRNVCGVAFVETVPNTECVGQYMHPIERKLKTGNLIKVNLYLGRNAHSLEQKRSDMWPIEWFGLTKLPNTFDDYDYAMGIVGP